MTRRNRIKGKRKIKMWQKATKAYNKVMQAIAKIKRDRLHELNVRQGYKHKIKLAKIERRGKNTIKGILV